MREHTTNSAPRPVPSGGLHRTVGPTPEFVPLVAWALVLEDAGSQVSSRIVGVVLDEDQQAKPILSPDDPSFLGYAGPGDAGIERAAHTPDWRALARQAIAELKRA